MKYRRDIDGLRALAVIPVVLFHAELSGFSGGFVGVDVFFVISGFLITSIIANEVREGSFSFLRFYQRRIARLFPALAVVVVATSIVSALVLMPNEFMEFGQSIVASLLFVSNILFWRQSGYFAGVADLKPLLHTWSLAIEEQFYFVFPPLLLLMHRWLRQRFWVVALMLLAALSFAVSEWAAQVGPNAAFYLLPSRIWELLLGALLAFVPARLAINRLGREVFALTGVLLIAWSVLTYTAATPFPGVSALFPTVGAALVILAGFGGSSLVGQVLSTRPLVLIGLMSYSLYLWHWPVMVFARHLGYPLHEPLHVVVTITLSFVLAYLSWRFVEKPFRLMRTPEQGRALFRWAGAASFSLVAVGLVFHATQGLPQRFGSPELIYGTLSERHVEASASYRVEKCFFEETFDFEQAKDCLIMDDTAPSFLLFGDSYAAHLWPGLTSTYPEIDFVQLNAATCRALYSVLTTPNPACQRIHEYVFSEFLPSQSHELAGIILASRWQADDLEALRETIEYIKRFNDNIYLVGPPVEYYVALADILIYRPDAVMHYHDETRIELDDELRTLAEEEGVHYLSTVSTLCDGESCITTTEDGELVQWDYGHLTPRGSELIANAWREGGVLLNQQ